MKTKKALIAGAIFALLVTLAVFGQRGERLRKITELGRRKSDATSQQLQEMTVDGKRRTYLLHMPAGGSSVRRLPLVIAFHGGGGNAENMEKMTAFNAKADKENFIVVYPNGTGPRENILLTFNAGGCCSYAMQNDIDDVTFISELIDKMIADRNVDKDRVYVTGFSNGAMISHRIAAELSDKIAAAAAVSGSVFKSSPLPKGKVAILLIHGTADTSVPYNGGNSSRQVVSGNQSEPFTSVKTTANYWAINNGCSTELVTAANSDIVRSKYLRCNGNNDVEVIAVKGGTHAWPGGMKGRAAGDAPSTALNATDEIWAFFKSHKKRP